MPAWAQAEPVRYWDAADEYERANGTVYREIEFALPAELSDDENKALAREYAEHLSQTSAGPTPYTLAIHRSEKNPNLLHCHLMLSDKVNDGIERDPSLWFRRASNSGKDPARGGAPKTQDRISKDWLGETVRPAWEKMANRALERAGIEARIDHRTLEARRQEQERLAQEAKARGDHQRALQHEQKAADLDRPAQPKRGPVLEHGGPKAAPDRARQFEEWKRGKSERQKLRGEVTITALDLAIVEREIAAAKAEIARQEREREAQARAREQADFVTSKEQRPGIRHPDKPRWQVERERILAETYTAELAEKMAKWYRIERREAALVLTNTQATVTDHGDRVTAAQGNDREIGVLVELAQAKGWERVHLTGSAEFQERAAKAFVAAGITLDDPALEQTAQQALRREQEARRVIEEQERRERKRQAVIEAEREARRQRLWELTETMQHDRGARMDIVQAYTAAGYVLVEQDGKRVLNYPHADLLEDREVVQAARKDWDARRQQRLAHEQEEEAQAEKAIQKPRNGQEVVPMLSDARPRKKTPWREWREKTLVERYGENVAAQAMQEDWYIRMRPDLGGLNIVVTEPKGGRHEIVDGGDILRSEGDGSRDIPLMLDLAQAKGWKELRIDGPEPFREAAALAAIKRGFALDDRALEQKARECLEAEAREKKNREVKRVSLAEFGVRRGEVLAVGRDRTTLTMYCPKTDETLQVDTGGKPLPEGLKPGHYIDASRNYLSGGLKVKEVPMPKDYQRRVQIQGKLPRLDLGLER